MSVIYNGKEYLVKREDNLLTLNLSGMGIKKISNIKGLETLTELQALNLNNNHISEIKNLENLTNLKDLQLERNLIKIIKGFDNLVNLRVLNLYKNNISEVENFSNMGNLRDIFLGGNPIYQTLVDTVGKVTPQTIEQYSKMVPEEKVDAMKKIQKAEIGSFSIERLKDLGYLFLFFLIGGIITLIGPLIAYSGSYSLRLGFIFVGNTFMLISIILILNGLKRK